MYPTKKPLNHQFLFLNGPPRSGKDYIARSLADLLPHTAKPFAFAVAVKNGTHASIGKFDIPYNHYEDCKDKPHPDFHGATPRQAYINFSEKYMKPTFGQDIFAKIMYGTICKYLNKVDTTQLIVFSDCGFDVEIAYFVDKFNAPNIHIAHLYRPGCDFSNDSRNYVNLEGVGTRKIMNNGTLEDLDVKIRGLAAVNFTC